MLGDGCRSVREYTLLSHDLKPDAIALREYVEGRASAFDRESNDNPGPSERDIALIQIGFEHEQSGYVAIVFDTRENAGPDGEWTMHIEAENNWIKFPRWAEITNHAFEGQTLQIIRLDGSSVIIDDLASFDSYEYAEIFGAMIKEVVLAARDDRVFASLPLTLNCEVCIEMINGLFVWPDTEDGVEPATK
jgi:hypothetical protein